MKYIRTLESLKEEELEEFKETIKMIFVDLIDEGFSVDIQSQKRTKSAINHYINYSYPKDYKQCNVFSVKLMRIKGIYNYPQNNKSEEFKYKITECFETLLALLNRRWSGARIEKIIRQDAVTANETYFHELDERVWSRDFISIAITIVKKEI